MYFNLSGEQGGFAVHFIRVILYVEACAQYIDCHLIGLDEKRCLFVLLYFEITFSFQFDFSVFVGKLFRISQLTVRIQPSDASVGQYNGAFASLAHDGLVHNDGSFLYVNDIRSVSTYIISSDRTNQENGNGGGNT